MVYRDDERLKSYLKEFRPVAPPPLPTKKRLFVRPRLVVASAAGALAATLVLAILFFYIHELGVPTHNGSPATQQITISQPCCPIVSLKQSTLGTPALTKLALEDSEAFGRVMTERLKTQLPAMEDERSTLRILAKE